MIKKRTIKSILGVIVLLAGTFLGVFYLNMTQVFRIGASPQTSPKDIRVSNVGDNTATISWTTEGETVGFITWGESQSSISKIEREDNTDSKYYTHNITITGLGESSTYFYKINSNGVSYDNNGIPWQFSTGPSLGLNSESFPVSGSIITASGNPQKRALVYLNVGGYLESTLTSETGVFVFQLGNIRSPDLRSFAAIDPVRTLLEISVQAGPEGVASAQIFPQSARPIPPIVLGQVYDLRNLEPNIDGQNPSVDLQLPEDASSSSKFNTATISGSIKPTSVILENISEGEVVTSTEPEFFGKGPSGETITITVNSENPITETVQIPTDGSWSWTPPEGLEPGPHSITISWIDLSGITRTLTRNFVVQAGELPAFTASESASTPTPTPQTSGTPIPTPTPTPRPLATGTPTPIPTPTLEAVPVTGELTPTIFMSIIGVLVVAFSFLVWRTSEDELNA
jgi:hypothetical protein